MRIIRMDSSSLAGVAIAALATVAGPVSAAAAPPPSPVTANPSTLIVADLAEFGLDLLVPAGRVVMVTGFLIRRAGGIPRLQD